MQMGYHQAVVKQMLRNRIEKGMWLDIFSALFEILVLKQTTSSFILLSNMQEERQALTEEAQKIHLTQEEREFKALIEKEPTDAPIFQVFQKFRNDIQGDMESKNTILVRRVFEFYVKQPEKWAPEDHYEHRREPQTFLTSIDPCRILVFGTDFLSQKQFGKKVKKQFKLNIPDIERVDGSHWLLTFSNGNEGVNFIEKTTASIEGKIIEKDSRGFPITNELTKSCWFKLWTYSFFKERSLEARFCLQGESLNYRPKKNIMYENAKSQMLKEFGNMEQNSQQLKEDQQAIVYGEKYHKRRQERNELHLENRNQSRIHNLTMRTMRDPSRSRQKRIQPNHNFSNFSHIQSVNRSYGPNTSFDSQKGFFDQKVHRQFQRIENRNKNLIIEREKRNASRENSFQISQPYCFDKLKHELSIIESNKSNKSYRSENDQKSFTELLNKDQENSILSMARRQEEKKKNEKKAKKKSRVEGEFGLDDLSELDNSSFPDRSESECIQKMSESEQDCNNLSIILPNNTSQARICTKQIDLSNFDLENDDEELQKIAQSNFQLSQPQKFSKRYQNFNSSSSQRELFEQPGDFHKQKNETQIFEYNPKRNKKVHKDNYNFCYRNYFEQTKGTSIVTKAAVNNVVNLLDD